MSKLCSLLTGTASGALSLIAASAVGLAAGQAAAAPAASAKTVAVSQVAAQIHPTTVNLRALAAAAAKSGPVAETRGPGQYRNIPLLRARPHGLLTQAQAAAGAPHASFVSKLGASSGTERFIGLDHFDQRILADNGNQFSLEPPDQALAVGKGRVLEVVNNAVQVYDTKGHALLSVPLSTNQFFGLPSQFNRTTGELGPFLSDPRAYYDWSTGRFFVAEWATLNQPNGTPYDISQQYLAVSQTSDPTGAWNVYSYDTTHQNHPGCPCIPDYNQLGIDRNGVYISNNLFQMFPNGTFGGFVGAIVYALPKAALEAGAPLSLLQFPILPGNFTVHPAVTPPHSQFALENGGTEYLLENTADFTNDEIGTSINVFAISNTNSLAGSSPSLTLHERSLDTQTVSANIPAGIQMDGPRPLGDSLGDPVPMLESLDGRFASNPVYVNGSIWAATPTAVVKPDSTTHPGVAWYQFTATGTATSFDVTLANQGIISGPKDTDLLFPAIAMNATGTGFIGVTITGPTRFPSSATIAMPQFGGAFVVLGGVGALPDDGFTAYPQFGGNGVGRWGDYAAAAMDETGNFWMANEMIPNTNQHPRSTLANWGTFITSKAP